MSIPAPTVSLNDNARLPRLGFGTWPMNNEEAKAAVGKALVAGYRLIDTAASYGNEQGVGRAIATSGVSRADVVLTTKLPGSGHGFDATLRAFDASLENLATDYVDLYLIHWPLPMRNRYVDSWRAMIRLQNEGRIRSLGVSNFNIEHIERLEAETGVRPTVNQIELHPDFTQPALRAWHAARGIVTEAWSPLGRGQMLERSELESIARKHDRTVSQVILRWHLEHGVVPIPKSENSVRIVENLDVFDFVLDEQDMDAIAALDRGNRRGGHPDTWVE